MQCKYCDCADARGNTDRELIAVARCIHRMIMFLYVKYRIMRIIVARLLLQNDTCDNIHFRGEILVVIVVIVVANITRCCSKL